MNTKIVVGAVLAVTLLSLYFSSSKSSPSFDSATLSKFKEFRRTHNKSYSSLEEHQYRLGVFSRNLKMIEDHNRQPGMSFTVGINLFADMTYEEFSAKFLSPMKDDPSKCEKASSVSTGDEKSVDWTKAGMVQRVKNQAQCGSCWAFSAVGALESAYALKNGELPDLSEQELVDCSKDYGNLGCNGGLMNFAYDYVQDNGLNTEKDYPYKGVDGKCQTPTIGKGTFGISSCVRAEPSTDGLIDAARKQPVAVAFHVSQLFMFYMGGVYDPWVCFGQPNHGVLVTGFDLEASKPFFRVKNSWAASWGEKGYFRIAIGKKKEGVCKIAGNGSNYYPVV